MIGWPSPRSVSRLLSWLAPVLAASCLAASPGLSEEHERLALTLLDGAELQFRSLDGRVLASIPTGEGPRSIVEKDGTLFVMNRGLEDRPGSSLTVVDGKGMTVERTVKICEGCAPRDAAFDDAGRLWFTGQAHRAVYWTESSYEEPAGSVLVSWGWPVEIVPLRGKGQLAVGVRGGSSVAIIDMKKKHAKGILTGRFPAILAYEAGRERLWAASDSGGPLAILSLGEGYDPAGHEIVREELFAGDAVLALDDTRYLISEKREKALLVLATDTKTEIARRPVEGTPGSIALSPDGRRAAVYVEEPDRIELFDIGADGSLTPSGRIDVGGRIGGLLWLR